MSGYIDVQTPKYGKRLPLRIIDERAENDPEREWLSIPRSSEPADGWEKISYRRAAKAISRVANRILELLGPAALGEFPTIAYVGPNDCRYLAFMFGAVKAGYKALFISPRNSAEGQLRLFKATDARAICCSAEFESAVQLWRQQRAMKHFLMLSEKQLLADTDDVSHIPYNKSFDEAQWDPLVVLHTSGSSGFPKPIVLVNGTMAIADAMRNVPRKFGTLPWVPEMASRGKRLLTPMPFFHISGLYVSVFFSTFYETISLGVGSRPTTPDMIYQSIQHSGADSIFVPPSIVEDMALVPEYIEELKKLKYVAWGGGSLTPHTGDLLVKNNVTLSNLTSSTEAGPYPFRFQPDSKNWHYFIIDDDYGGNDFRKMPGDEDIYKHFFKRQSKDPGLQGIFWTFPNLDEFDTQDLYRPHPTLKDHWTYYGRADSIIVFSNGEKLNPVSIEATVLSHPKIKGTLVVGTNRLEPALLLEPVNHPSNEEETKNLIQSVWPLVQQANHKTVAHGHIQYDMILLTKPEKPFPRAGKGSIQRPMAVQLYESEISLLYDTLDREPENVPVIDIGSESALQQSLHSLLLSNLGVPELGPDTDFFTMGMNSLQVIVVCRLISAGLKAAGHELDGSLPARAVYSNPTLTRLSSFIFRLMESAEANHENPAGGADLEMKEMVEEYTQNLPAEKSGKSAPEINGQTVLLTGTTGALGSYLLDLMISDDKVAKILCFNRDEDGGRQRQVQALAKRGLTSALHKCEFVHADLSLPDLGLGELYTKIQGLVDRIIHNAWPVNFNIPLSSFEPSVRGVRNLVDLSLGAPRQVPIIFISSISSVDGWTDGSVPELPVQHLHMAAMGYGQSKHVSSLILDEASRLSGVPTASIRIGQIGGSRGEAGVWNKKEWFPSIMASSVYLGALPEDLGRLSTVDWVPIEDVARLVLEISLKNVEDISGYFHCVNPTTTAWKDLAPAAKEYYGHRITKLVTFKEWVDLLRKSSVSTKDIERNPGVKLLDTYEAQASGSGRAQILLEMTRTKKYSATARNLSAITPALVQNWCKQWNF